MEKRRWVANRASCWYTPGAVVVSGSIVGEGPHHGRDVLVEMTPEKAREVAANLVRYAAQVEGMNS